MILVSVWLKHYSKERERANREWRWSSVAQQRRQREVLLVC